MIEIPIVLIGHKDHGKSTLIGRLLLDSKSIKQSRLKEVQEVDRASGQKFELAHLVDSFKEEREKEMTMDTTQVLLKGKTRNYQLIDVPGHGELISQMLTGASRAQAALLMVSITEGIKEQTCQHLEIAKLLGIKQLGVAVNKLDLINYQKSQFNKIIKNLKTVLKKIGYPLKNVHFFPISAWRGDNVTKKSPKTLWYHGSTIMNFLEKKVRATPSMEKWSLQFLVQDQYKENNQQLLIGQILSGKLKTGQKILFLPTNKKTKVAQIKDADGELKQGRPGQNLGIILAENLKIPRGAVGVLPNAPLKVNNVLSGEIFWIKKPSQKNLVLECGTCQSGGMLKKPKRISQREKTPFVIALKKPIVFQPKGETILSKIVLKDKGEIIGIGRIL